MVKVRYEAGRFIFYCTLCGHRISWFDDSTRITRLLECAYDGTSCAERCEHCGRLLVEPPSDSSHAPYAIHENSDGTFDVYDKKLHVTINRQLPTRLAATICAERLAASKRRDLPYWLYMDRKRRGDLLGC